MSYSIVFYDPETLDIFDIQETETIKIVPERETIKIDDGEIVGIASAFLITSEPLENELKKVNDQLISSDESTNFVIESEDEKVKNEIAELKKRVVEIERGRSNERPI